MALISDDRIFETTTTTGTGALALAGAAVGFKAFSAVCSIGDTCYYSIEAVDGSGVPTGDWETGLGTYSAANTLTRTTPQKSSNANAAVTFAAGTKRVYISSTAAQLAALAGAAPVAVPVSLGRPSLAVTGSPAVNYYLSTLLVADADFTITKVAFETTGAQATPQYQAFVYSDNAGVPGTLLGSSAQVTGTLAGYNEVALTSPVAISKGTLVWVGVSVTVAALSLWQAISGRGAYTANGGSTVPASTPGGWTALTGNPTYAFWAVGLASSVVPASSYQASAKLWRLRAPYDAATYSGTNNFISIGEVQFKDAGGTVLTSGGTAIAGSWFNATFAPSTAFDGVLPAGDSGWICRDGLYVSGLGFTLEDVWLGYSSPSAITPTQVTLYPHANYINQWPSKLVIEFSSDGGNSWTPVTKISTAAPVLGTGQTFTIPAYTPAPNILVASTATPILVQYVNNRRDVGSAGTQTFTLAAAPTVGNILVLMVTSAAAFLTLPAGWKVAHAYTFTTSTPPIGDGQYQSGAVIWKEVVAGDAAAQTFTFADSANGTLMEISGANVIVARSLSLDSGGTTWAIKPMGQLPGANKLLFLAVEHDGTGVVTADAAQPAVLWQSSMPGTTANHRAVHMRIDPTLNTRITGAFSAASSHPFALILEIAA